MVLCFLFFLTQTGKRLYIAIIQNNKSEQNTETCLQSMVSTIYYHMSMEPTISCRHAIMNNISINHSTVAKLLCHQSVRGGYNVMASVYGGYNHPELLTLFPK